LEEMGTFFFKESLFSVSNNMKNKLNKRKINIFLLKVRSPTPKMWELFAVK